MATSQSLSTHDRDEFIIKHLGIVQAIAFSIQRRYSIPLSMLSDMVEDGRVGLVEAARRYVPREGGSFAAYANAYIKGTIMQGLKHGGLLLESRMKKDLPIDKISFPAAWDSVKEIQSRLETTEEHREAQDEPDEQVLFQQQLSQALKHIDKLTQKEAAVVTARFKDHKSLRQIARDFGINRSTVKGHIARSIGKLNLCVKGLGKNIYQQGRKQRHRDRSITNRLRAAIPPGLSQRQLSMATGIGEQWLNEVVNGKVPGLAIALVLAKELGKPVEELFQLDDRREAGGRGDGC